MALTRITKGVIKPNENYDTHNIHSTGIVTATKFVGPFDNINVSGAATFTGNVTIGGTLTYEDVTNIDSVGIITAQKDIHVGAGVSAVGVGTFGSLDISGDVDVDGHTNLDNVSISGVTTAAGAIDLNADLDVDGHTNLDNVSIAGVTTITQDLDVDGHTNLDNVSIAGVTTFSTGPVVPNGTYYKGVINSGSQQKIVGGYISGSNTLRLGESMYLTTVSYTHLTLPTKA